MSWYWVILIAWIVGVVSFALGCFIHMWMYDAYNDDELHGRQEWQQSDKRDDNLTNKK